MVRANGNERPAIVKSSWNLILVFVKHPPESNNNISDILSVQSQKGVKVYELTPF